MSLEILDYDRKFTARDLRKMNKDEFESLAAEYMAVYQQDRKENALLYYVPASPQAEAVHESTAFIRGVFGGNRCLPLDEPVLMADGKFRALGEIRPGDRVIACDPATGQAVPANVVRTYRSGIKPVYRISFSDGGSFRATPEHNVPIYLGSGRWTSKGKPKFPYQRRLAYFIDAINERGAKNPSKRISAISPCDIRFDETKLGLHPYLLGAWLGDGCSRAASVGFSNTDAAVLEKFRALLEPMNMVLVYRSGCDYGIINAGQQRGRKPGGMNFANRFILQLEKLRLAGKNSYTKFLPDCVWGLSRKDRIELLCGLIDTDGGTNSYSSVSKALADGFAGLMRSIGGKATIAKRVATCQTGASVEYYQVYWRCSELLPLMMPHKQVPLGKRAVDLQRRICRSAEFVGYAECGDLEVDHPAHCYVAGDYVVVSNSSKTETALVEGLIQATGVVPTYLRERYPDIWKKKLRGPIHGRVVCQSLVNILETTILPKLRWNLWSGSDDIGGEKGHFGWIPKMCLIDGDWNKSWSTKSRTLRFYYRNPENLDEIIGESSIQFFSYDQDPADFASAHCHFVLMDEPPPEAIYRENKTRTMSAKGWLLISMTWPDDPSINCDWLYEEIYEKGTPGSPLKEDGYECFQLQTTENRHIDQETVAQHMRTMSDTQKRVRIYGQQIRFSNRVHPDFTDLWRTWCFQCGEDRPAEERCLECGSEDVVPYNHVEDFTWPTAWPVVWVVDPHPRKPHMVGLIGVTPQDDFWQVGEVQCEGDPTDLRKATEEFEFSLGLRVVRRLIDPRMSSNPSGIDRERTWGDEFDSAGLYCEPADSSDVGRALFDQYLKPDPRTRTPRVRVHKRCTNTQYQMKRFMWDDWRVGTDKGQKQKVKEKYDDYPAIWRYFCNSNSTYEGLTRGGQILQAGSGLRRYPSRAGKGRR